MKTSNQAKKGSDERGVSVKLKRSYYAAVAKLARASKRTLGAQLEVMIDAYGANNGKSR